MVLYWNIDQWARIESPGIHPCVSGQMIFDKGPKTIQQKTVSLITGVRKTGYLHAEKMKLDSPNTIYRN